MNKTSSVDYHDPRELMGTKSTLTLSGISANSSPSITTLQSRAPFTKSSSFPEPVPFPENIKLSPGQQEFVTATNSRTYAPLPVIPDTYDDYMGLEEISRKSPRIVPLS